MKELIGFEPAKFFEWVAALPPEPLTVIAVLMLGYALKRAEWVSNKAIPLVLMVAGPIFLIVARYGLLRFVVEGIVYAGAAWIFHAQVWKRFIAPKLGGASGGFDSDPEAFKKTEEDKTKENTP